MKRFLQLTLLAFIAFVGSVVTSNSAYATSYAIGDTGPAGGKIFITPSTVGNSTGKYFEVAPVDISASRLNWCNSTSQLISGTLHSEIGAGSTNTQAMLNWGCTSGAAIGVNQYSLGGKTDWFLPSLDEAAQLYATKAATGLFDGSPSLDNLDTHWTSTGNDASTSWVRYFTSNVVYALNQENGSGGFFVRAVRSFTPTKTDAEIAEENAAKDAADKKKAEAARAARIQEARTALTYNLENGIDFTTQLMLEADTPFTRKETMLAYYRELKSIQSKLTSPLSETEKIATKSAVAHKYVTIEKITTEFSPRVFARDFVRSGLIAADTPQKTRIIAALASMPVESRKNMDEVNAFIAKELSTVNERRARLAARLSQNS